MLHSPIALHDIENCEAFVRDTLRRSTLPFGDDEYEEMVAEGLLILCELSKRYRPRLDGYDTDGCFSGYAARYLPRRLGDAWHRRHPEHRRVTDPTTGRRRWHYDRPPTSLTAILAGDTGAVDSEGARRPHREEVRLRGINEFVPVAA